ncbi:hypothetical protein FRX31_017805 [Thalictrum thalictroides]|uniref:Secreted protein n=1 Tax=Thalictrum thalictroides TaxID=46969 RepID=A0A7J6W5G2_THATH|nr:hypothetical protein FRX31_017805 [Thalictrum thalictroides]
MQFLLVTVTLIAIVYEVFGFEPRLGSTLACCQIANVLGTSRGNELFTTRIHILGLLQRGMGGYCNACCLYTTVVKARRTSAPLPSFHVW